MKRILTIACILCCSTFFVNAQLPDGSTFPDITVTDINGNSHRIYDYLAQGKTVILDVFATWCGPCWNYHQLHILNDIYNTLGPNGTNEAMVMAIESDLTTNLNCIFGSAGCNNTTWGDWTTGIDYPIVSLVDPATATSLQISFYPTLYTICPDGKVFESGQISYNQYADWVQKSCPFSASVVNVNHNNCFGDDAGAIDIEPVLGSGGITYVWSNGQVTQDINGLEGGLYSCTLTEGNGRTIELVDILINEPPILEATVDAVTDVTCFNQSNGSIDVTSSGGTPGLTYSWSNGATTEDLQSVPGGDYVLTITDANNCQTVTAASIDEPADIALLTVTYDEYCDQADGVVVGQADGGTVPFTYILDGEQNQSGFFEDKATGFYDLVVRDANGCEKTETVYVDALPTPHADAGIADQLTCTTSEITLDGSMSQGGSNIEYEWTTTDGNIVSGADGLSPVVDAAGTYTLTVGYANNSCHSTDVVTVVADEQVPTAHAGEAFTMDCGQVQAQLDGSGSSQGATIEYQWITTDGIIVSGGTTTTPTIEGAGTYTLQVTDISNGCESVHEVVVDERDGPVTADFSFQDDELKIDFENSIIGEAQTVLWEFGDGEQSAEATPEHTYDIPGTYNVCLTVENECFDFTVCKDVEAYYKEIKFEIASSNVRCFDGSDGTANVNITKGNPPYTIYWNDVEGPADRADLTAGPYDIKVTDIRTLIQNNEITISQPDEIVAESLEIQHEDADEKGAISIDILGGVQPYTLLWSNGETTANIDNLDAGDYSLTVTDKNDCVMVLGPYTVDRLTATYNTFANGQVRLYPVPASEALHVQIDTEESFSGHIRMFNVQGKEVTRSHWETNDQHVTIPLRHLSDGIYLITIADRHGVMKFSSSILVQHE